jgi:transcriptional antiterminator RfaH
MSLHGNKIWSAVSLKPNQANKAEANLSQQGFNYLCPKIKVTKRQKNKFINKTELLFPGYLFVEIDIVNGDVRKVQSTHGVSSIIRFGSKIGVVPEAFMSALLINSDFKNSLHTETLMSGQQVKITKGPFAGLIGKLSQVDTSTRVKCLFNLMSGNIIGSVLKEDLIAVY